MRHYDSKGQGPLFADPEAYLPAADYAAYQNWTAWAQKPASLDFVVPSKEYFSLGRVKSFTGDLGLPGTMFKLIEVCLPPEIIDANAATSQLAHCDDQGSAFHLLFEGPRQS